MSQGTGRPWGSTPFCHSAFCAAVEVLGTLLSAEGRNVKSLGETHLLPSLLPFLYGQCEKQLAEGGADWHAGGSLGISPKTKSSSWDWQPGGGTTAGVSPGAT